MDQRPRGRSGIFAFNAALPAGVTQYVVLPRASVRFSIQPFAIIPAKYPFAGRMQLCR
jgi:hypothetical protein